MSVRSSVSHKPSGLRPAAFLVASQAASSRGSAIGSPMATQRASLTQLKNCRAYDLQFRIKKLNREKLGRLGSWRQDLLLQSLDPAECLQTVHPFVPRLRGAAIRRASPPRPRATPADPDCRRGSPFRSRRSLVCSVRFRWLRSIPYILRAPEIIDSRSVKTAHQLRDTPRPKHRRSVAIVFRANYSKIGALQYLAIAGRQLCVRLIQWYPNKPPPTSRHLFEIPKARVDIFHALTPPRSRATSVKDSPPSSIACLPV